MALDGTLIFGTEIDNSGFNSGISTLQVAAGNAIGNIAANMVSQISSAAAQIPAQIISIGSGFEASLSQVAATMGITSAAAEFEILSDAAKEMGETTKFSASQAGEALNYLALAGYDAKKAVSALPTVLNVAAAGGMELAAASDMITDAMSALGLETNQMSDFADKLAVTSQKSNTSVSQLGEAILTVGGTAKNLAGGITEMNTVLGILADNGIKGAEGGTALRNVILSLTAPTSTAAKAIDSLGVSVFDNEGKMRSLKDIIYDLNDALSIMNDAEKSQALSDIFNKVDLKSVNALLGTSAERFDQLSGYIDNCSDAAADMAETMDDNLKGDLTIMQSALEGLGIAAYEKFQEPMRTAVQSVTEDFGTLTSSITDGALSASFDNVSSKLAELASNVSSFLSEDALPSLINGVSWLIDNFNSFIPVLSAAATAIVSYKVAVIAATAATTAFEIAHSGMLLTLVTNPIFLTISAITLLTAAVAAYIVQANKVSEAYTSGANIYSDQIDSLDRLKKSYNDVRKSAQQKIDSEEENINTLSALKKELDKNIDANGNIIGNYELVKSLIEEINQIYPDTIELIDGQIQGYDKLSSSIDNYIDSLRKQTLLNAKKEVWSKAVVVYDETSSKNDELLQNALASDDPYKEALHKYKKYKNGVNNYTKADYDAANAAGMEIGEYLRSQYEYYRGVWESSWQAYNENKQLMDQASADIATYEDALRNAATPDSSPWASYFKKQTEWLVEARQDAVEEIELTNEEITQKLSEGWKNAEHNYAMGIIGSEEELYAKKQQLLDEYGNAELEEHWQYYEDLYGYQQDYADRSKQLYEQQLNDEWLAIEHNNSLGLLSDEEAYKKKLAFIQKYCPDYSDEWYDYYKDISDYQKNAMQEQVDVFKSGLNTIKNEYKDAYNEISSKIEAYKQKLLSVGSALEVIQNDDGSKTLKVNDLREQMAEMRKYASFVKQLKEQGASEGLLSELTSMDFKDGSEFAKNLAKMSSEDFAQINDYYKEKEALAQELATDLYQSELDSLNENLASGILAQFGALPQEIQAAGAEAITAFINGLNNGDMTTQVEDFCNDFVDACNEGIKNGFDAADFSDSFEQLYEQDTYSIGKSLGDDFAEGFNAALAEMQAAVAVEQAAVSAEYTAGKHGGNQSNGETLSSDKRIVIENKTTVELDVDGEKLAEKVIEKTDVINQRKGV